MTYGYLYCFSNISMPNMLKIGMTERSPDIRLKEANTSDTWRPPTPYKIEFAKKVLNPKQKEITLHTILEQYGKRINSKREFFNISIEEVKAFFELIDGEIWIEENVSSEEIENEEPNDEETNIKIGNRNMEECFNDGQRIRHKIGINKIWIGTYNSSKNCIKYKDNIFDGRSPLNQFAKSHYDEEKSSRVSVNAWRECEYDVNGKWISTYNI
jgi:hypothetical protein